MCWPVFRYFTPMDPRNFWAPTPLFVRIQLCSVKFPSTVNQFNNTCNFSLVDSLFFPHTILQSRFFKYAALGPGPGGPCVNTGLLMGIFMSRSRKVKIQRS